MYAVATFLVVAVLSMLFTRIAAGVLIATGLPPEVASFQARSAFSGAGFTTTEAENVVNHPIRRRVIGTTMFVGNLGTPTLIVTVLIGFLAPGPGNTIERTLVVISGLALVVMILGNRPVRKYLVRVGQRQAEKRLLPHLEHEVVEICSIDDDYVVARVRVADEPGPTVRSLRGIDEAFREVHVLGVRHGEEYLGMPPVDVELAADDVIVLYGRREELKALQERMTSDDGDVVDGP